MALIPQGENRRVAPYLRNAFGNPLTFKAPRQPDVASPVKEAYSRIQGNPGSTAGGPNGYGSGGPKKSKKYGGNLFDGGQ